MSTFEKMISNYRRDILEEAEVPPPVDDPAAGGAAPPPEGAPAPEEPMPDPEDVVDELGKASDKPWVDLAGVLSRTMERQFTNDEINLINESLPEDLTISSFVDARTNPQIRDKYSPNIESAAITLFDIVDKIMSDNGMAEVVPAEQR